LPDFRYDAGSRKDFSDSFVQMIKCIHGQFMIRNEMRQNPESMAAEVSDPAGLQGFFSPRRDRIIGSLETPRDAVESRPGLVSPYLYGDKRQVQGGVQGAHLPRPETPFAAATRSKTEVMPRHDPHRMDVPPTSGAFMSPVYQVRKPATDVRDERDYSLNPYTTEHSQPTGWDSHDSHYDHKYGEGMSTVPEECESEASVSSTTSTADHTHGLVREVTRTEPRYYGKPAPLVIPNPPRTPNHDGNAQRDLSNRSLRLGQSDKWDIPDVWKEEREKRASARRASRAPLEERTSTRRVGRAEPSPSQGEPQAKYEGGNDLAQQFRQMQMQFRDEQQRSMHDMQMQFASQAEGFERQQREQRDAAEHAQ
jgi:hypothetical protein